MRHSRYEKLQSFRHSLRYAWHRLPDWFAPAAYGAAVFALVAATFAVLTAIGSSPGPHAVTQQTESKRLAARAPMDNPDTAPELSPVYPTAAYNMPPSTGQAEAARKLAREGKPQAFTIPSDERDTRETFGYAPRFIPRGLRSEPMQ